jgi:hypothetical protein
MISHGNARFAQDLLETAYYRPCNFPFENASNPTFLTPFYSITREEYVVPQRMYFTVKEDEY